MPEPVFLALEDILFIHQQEIQLSRGRAQHSGSRRNQSLCRLSQSQFRRSLSAQPVWNGCKLYFLPDDAPSVDGNKRAALACALTFLYLNGYTVEESYNEELADIIVNFVTKKISKENVAEYFKSKSIRL